MTRDLIKTAISKIVHRYNINHYHYQLFVVEWHHWLVNLVLGQKGAESPGDNHEEPQFDPRWADLAELFLCQNDCSMGWEQCEWCSQPVTLAVYRSFMSTSVTTSPQPISASEQINAHAVLKENMPTVMSDSLTSVRCGNVTGWLHRSHRLRERCKINLEICIIQLLRANECLRYQVLK